MANMQCIKYVLKKKFKIDKFKKSKDWNNYIHADIFIYLFIVCYLKCWFLLWYKLRADSDQSFFILFVLTVVCIFYD